MPRRVRLRRSGHRARHRARRRRRRVAVATPCQNTSPSSKPTRRISLRKAEPARRLDAPAHLGHQRQHVVGAPTVVGLDEVGVLVGHRGAAEATTTQPGCVDQRAGADLARHRVDEHRAGVLAAGLVCASPAHDLGDQTGSTRRRHRAAAGARHRATTWSGARPHSIGSASPSSAADRVRSAPAARSKIVTSDQRRRHVGSVTTGVHPDRPADRAGNADGPLEPGESGRRGLAGEHRERHPGRRGHPCRVPVDVDGGVEIGEADRDSGEPGIGDEQVRAATRPPAPAARMRRRLGDGGQLSAIGRRGRTAPPRRRRGRWSSGRAERRAARHRRGRRGRESATLDGVSVDATSSTSDGKRGDVAAPHRDADVAVARARPRGTTTRSSRRGSHTTRRDGIGFGDGVDDQLAGHARDRNACPTGRCR